MNQDMKNGAIMALQGVKEEMNTITAELARKGFDKPKVFSVLEQFVEDSINDFGSGK